MVLIVDGYKDEAAGRVKNVTMRQSRVHAVELAFFTQTDLSEKISRLQFGGN
jgi:hypothetical protein